MARQEGTAPDSYNSYDGAVVQRGLIAPYTREDVLFELAALARFGPGPSAHVQAGASSSGSSGSSSGGSSSHLAFTPEGTFHASDLVLEDPVGFETLKEMIGHQSEFSSILDKPEIAQYQHDACKENLGNGTEQQNDDERDDEEDDEQVNGRSPASSHSTELSIMSHKRGNARDKPLIAPRNKPRRMSVPSIAEGKRDKNKIAAAKCRQKKRDNMNVIESNHRALSSENSLLRRQEQQLRATVAELRTMALDHSGCNCGVNHFNLFEAGKIAQGLGSLCSGSGGGGGGGGGGGERGRKLSEPIIKLERVNEHAHARTQSFATGYPASSGIQMPSSIDFLSDFGADPTFFEFEHGVNDDQMHL